MSAASPGAAAIARERARQVDFAGWTPEHDAHHGEGELLGAGIAYARAVEVRRVGFPPDLIRDGITRGGTFRDAAWPWAMSTFKPSDDGRDLVRAGALIAAELDRLGHAGAVLL